MKRFRAMYSAIGVKNIDKILPPPQQPTTNGPCTLKIFLAMTGKPFQAFKGQDHASTHNFAFKLYVNKYCYEIIQSSFRFIRKKHL